MNALIIGAAGFVGKYLIDHLRDDRGWSVSASKLPHEAIDAANIRICDLDILDKNAIVKALREAAPDYIFHLAAQSSVSLSWKEPGLTVDVNIRGTVNVLDAVRELEKKPRVLLIGSGEEYGHVLSKEIPIGEENVLRPGNIYAATKACQGMIGRIYANAYGLDVIMVRAFNHIGPGQSPVFVASDFCKQVAEIEAGLREPVIRVGNLSARRDFTDVRDVVRAYGLLMEKGRRGELYNVGSGKAVAIEEILHTVLACSDAKISVEADASRLRPVDVPVIEADTRRLQTLTGWKPEIDLRKTIAETLLFWRKNIA